jgi:hypothetical protein
MSGAIFPPPAYASILSTVTTVPSSCLFIVYSAKQFYILRRSSDPRTASLLVCYYKLCGLILGEQLRTLEVEKFPEAVYGNTKMNYG